MEAIHPFIGEIIGDQVSELPGPLAAATARQERLAYQICPRLGAVTPVDAQPHEVQPVVHTHAVSAVSLAPLCALANGVNGPIQRGRYLLHVVETLPHRHAGGTLL